MQRFVIVRYESVNIRIEENIVDEDLVTVIHGKTEVAELKSFGFSLREQG